MPAPIAVIGNANLDLVGGPLDLWPERGTETFLKCADSRVGGSAANTALVLQRLGSQSGLIASAGEDIVGKMIQAQFVGPLDRIARTPGPSSITFGLLHSGSERTFFSTPGHLDTFDCDQIRESLEGWPLEGALALVSGSFALPALADETTSLLSELHRSGARTAIDPGWPDSGWTLENRSRVLDWVAQSDIVLLNDKEALGLTQKKTVDLAIESLAPILRFGAELVIKCGPEGAKSVVSEARFKASSPASNIVDTIGAGDAFNAGYLAARQMGLGPSESLTAGCAVASAVIQDFPRSSTRLDLSGFYMSCN